MATVGVVDFWPRRPLASDVMAEVALISSVALTSGMTVADDVAFDTSGITNAPTPQISATLAVAALAVSLHG